MRVGADRFVIISSMGADNPPKGDETFSVYLRAKAAADEAARDAAIDETIVRPGGLTDDEPTGSVHIDGSTGRGEVPRADVAAVLATLIHTGTARGETFELLGGDTPIAEALAAIDWRRFRVSGVVRPNTSPALGAL